MRSRIVKSFSFLPALALGAFVLSTTGALAAGLEQQDSRANGVSISVTPADVAAANWRFDVRLTTHSGSLDDDLTKSAKLIAAGKQYAPAGWEGSAPGGHHRSGVLSFKAVSPRPAAIELRIVRQGEAAPREFRWKLK